MNTKWISLWNTWQIFIQIELRWILKILGYKNVLCPNAPILDLENSVTIFHQAPALFWLFLTHNGYIKKAIYNHSNCLCWAFRFWNFPYRHKPHNVLHHLADFHLKLASMNSWTISLQQNVFPTAKFLDWKIVAPFPIKILHFSGYD